MFPQHSKVYKAILGHRQKTHLNIHTQIFYGKLVNNNSIIHVIHVI